MATTTKAKTPKNAKLAAALASAREIVVSNMDKFQAAFAKGDETASGKFISAKADRDNLDRILNRTEDFYA